MAQTETAPGTDQVARSTRSWLVVLSGLVAALVVLVVVLLVKVNTLQDQVDLVEATASGAQQPADMTVGDPRLDDVCRFIGVWAARSGVTIDQLFPGATVGACEQTATDAYHAAKH